MRSARIGDVYAVRVPNGYKLVQWGYYIEKYGKFIRVFDGLYTTIPENIAEIVGSPHSYITSLHVSRAYRIGLMDWLGNYPVPEEFPFPAYMVEFNRDQYGRIYQITIMKTPIDPSLPRRLVFPATSIRELPEPYHNVQLLAAHVPPDWLLYLFDNDFSLDSPDIFEPRIHWGEKWKEKYQQYIDMVADALARDPRSKKLIDRYLQET